MLKIAVCAIFKDEGPYLLEWLAFHKLIGVDLFFLYDNDSSDGGSDIIAAIRLRQERDGDPVE